jgi:hypothetical protein
VIGRSVIHAGVAAAIAAAIAAISVPGAAAAAEDSAVLISLDGVSFSSTPEGAIFDAGVVLVPGSNVTGTFHVRNNSARVADLRISVMNTTSADVTFIENLTLLASTRVTQDTDAVQLQQGETCTPLLRGELLQPGADAEVSITLAMTESVDNAHQGSTADTELMVALADPGTPTTALADCIQGGGIPLTRDPLQPVRSGEPRTPSSAGIDESADQPSAGTDAEPTDSATGEELSATGAPSIDTPTTSGSPPLSSGGQAVLFPWMGVGTAVLAAGLFLGIKNHRKRQVQ